MDEDEVQEVIILDTGGQESLNVVTIAGRKAVGALFVERHGGFSGNVETVWLGSASSVMDTCHSFSLPFCLPLPLDGAACPHRIAGWLFMRHLLHWWLCPFLHLPVQLPVLYVRQI